ncbi:Zn-dependent hydrolase [Aureimonas leprariae]|uniref:Zn-dependent hydrolase n=1 Tax=Plantimonas leprariae TaxID=2615207 RepID=A0A7V7PMV0_9HYPH|nr:Zn-dependent hydrolase [Aureimonas leprariae]KAB0678479.1 Zn-dependent hydrolase [Aureimonas leprariae]
MSRTPAVNGERLLARLAAFAAIGATPKGGVDRQALTAGDREARRLLADLAAARGFAVLQDEAANLFVRREGTDPSLPPLLLGSHLDTQPKGGRFDGTLGVLAAFEVLEALEDVGARPARAVEAVAWTNEEGSRFQPGAFGSQAFAGGTIPSEWREAQDRDGMRLSDELRATLAALPQAKSRPLGIPLAAYLELHIEQGPALEAEDVAIGAVTGIQATRWLEVSFTGRPAHAGTTPLAFRRDPLVAAVAVLGELHRSIMPADGDARLTVGRIAAEPGSINVVPERVAFTLDLRHPDDARLAAIDATVREICARHAAAAGCRMEVTVLSNMRSAAFPESVVTLVETAAARSGLSCRRIVSGAFHDALFLSRVAASGMIFVPCRDGISHNEAEDVAPAASIDGATALLNAAVDYLELAGAPERNARA